jgi:hypothetical protein
VFEIRKATRKRAKARIGISGASGSGKTYSSLLIAFGLCSGKENPKIGVIDTENSSAELYAPNFEHLGGYYVIQLFPPYDPQKYIDAIHAFERENFDVIIIDSLSHAWAGTGGLLEQRDKLIDTGSNSFSSWRDISPLHNRLVETILTSSAHIIATFRAKTAYVVAQDGDKTRIIKAGLAPVQRPGIEYEFTTFFELTEDHNCKATKDRTGLFDQQIFVPTIETGQKISEYLNSGVDPVHVFIDEMKKATTLEELKVIWDRISPEVVRLNTRDRERVVSIKNELKEKLSKTAPPTVTSPLKTATITPSPGTATSTKKEPWGKSKTTQDQKATTARTVTAPAATVATETEEDESDFDFENPVEGDDPF